MSAYFIISDKCHNTNICCSTLSAASQRKSPRKFSLRDTKCIEAAAGAGGVWYHNCQVFCGKQANGQS